MNQEALDLVRKEKGLPHKDIGELVELLEQDLRSGGANEGDIEEHAGIVERFLHRRFRLSWDAIGRLNTLMNHLQRVASAVTLVRLIADFLKQEVSPSVLMSIGGVLTGVALILAVMERNVRLRPRGPPATRVPDVRPPGSPLPFRATSPRVTPMPQGSLPRGSPVSIDISPSPRPESPPPLMLERTGQGIRQMEF